MNTEDKFSFFLDMIQCNYTLYLWDYDADFHFLGTNWNKSLFSNDILSILGLGKLIETHLEKGNRVPLIIEGVNNVLWIAGFWFQDEALCHTYLIGPVFGGRDTHLIIRKKLDSYNLSVQLRSTVQKVFADIPTIPSNLLLQYATMLHYCLNNERITVNEIMHATTSPTKSNVQIGSSDHSGIWLNEEKLCKMFEEGNPEYKEILMRSHALSSGVKADIGDALRSNKNNLLVLLTLCSRSCIRGGLNPSIAYDLNDYYAQKIEECTSFTDTTALSGEMLEDYVSRVREAHKQTSISPLIQNSCNYIRQHIKEALSISFLANRIGYTEYYFSHKFKKEVGCNVKEYIIKEKIEQSKLLLSGTNENIQEISDEFSFSNRSYFYSCFQKYVGMSPSEYRSQNHKM